MLRIPIDIEDYILLSVHRNSAADNQCCQHTASSYTDRLRLRVVDAVKSSSIVCTHVSLSGPLVGVFRIVHRELNNEPTVAALEVIGNRNSTICPVHSFNIGNTCQLLPGKRRC